MARQKA